MTNPTSAPTATAPQVAFGPQRWGPEVQQWLVQRRNAAATPADIASVLVGSGWDADAAAEAAQRSLRRSDLHRALYATLCWSAGLGSLGLATGLHQVLADTPDPSFAALAFTLAVVLLPLLRSLRLFRLVVLVGALQKAIGHAIRGKVIIYTISGAVLLVYVGALAVLEAERGAPDAHITTFGHALWWAMSTITTVGYGDMYPVTTTGRFFAALLMIGGISLVGSITATIASWIVQSVSNEDEKHDAVTAAHIVELRSEIAELRELLRSKVNDAADGTADAAIPR